MEVNEQIKKYRTELNLSQEELAEKVFVSRQTISNWETAKSYPDIHSLLLLSTVFNVSLDQLIKGDINIMKEEIRESEVKKFNRYGNILFVLWIVLFATVPLLLWGIRNEQYLLGILPFGLVYAVTMFVALKTEKVKKENNIHTFKEIVAFQEGKRLDELQTVEEKAKRPYQKVLLVIGSAVVMAVVCILIGFLMDIFTK